MPRIAGVAILAKDVPDRVGALEAPHRTRVYDAEKITDPYIMVRANEIGREASCPVGAERPQVRPVRLTDHPSVSLSPLRTGSVARARPPIRPQLPAFR